MSPILGGMLVVDWLGVIITQILGGISDLATKKIGADRGGRPCPDDTVDLVPIPFLARHVLPDRYKHPLQDSDHTQCKGDPEGPEGNQPGRVHPV